MRAILLAAVSGLAIHSAAFAQEQSVDEVVITATRTETETIRVPGRVDVIDRKEMDDRVLITAVEALRSVPGLSVVQSGGPGSLTSVFVRGSNSKHVLALFDGIRLNDMSSPNGLYNFGEDTTGGLDRIEVARGAYSSVYGSDAIGGVINFIPRVGGTEAFEPYYEATAGSRNTLRGLAGAVGTVGQLSYAVSVDHFRTDGFNNTPERYPDGLGDDDESTFTTITALANVEVSEIVTLKGLARWRKAEVEIDEAALDRLALTSEDQYSVWRVGPSFSLLDGKLRVDLEGGQVLIEREALDAVDVNEMFPDPNETAEGTRDFANWRNVLTLGDAGPLQDVTLSGGLEWRNEEISVVGGYNDPLSRSEDSSGAYALAQVGVLDRVDLTASARFDKTGAFDDATTWNLGAVLRLPEIGGRVFASVGSSFKAPTLSERFTTSFFVDANPALKPEEGQSWEAGVDASHGWVKAGAVYFENEIRNLIVTDFGLGQNVNIEKADIHGHELFVEVEPDEMISLHVDYTYTDARNAMTGVQLQRRPTHQWAAQLEFTPTEALRFGLEYRSRGDRRDVLYSTTPSPWGPGGSFVGDGPARAYSVIDATASYRFDERITVFTALRNLGDQTYEEPAGYAGEPRTWLVGLRGSF